MLKHLHTLQQAQKKRQPPSGGCVLKLVEEGLETCLECQPPSGGCVLKLNTVCAEEHTVRPAAFRRLCVETVPVAAYADEITQPPSGGCVLKRYLNALTR